MHARLDPFKLQANLFGAVVNTRRKAPPEWGLSLADMLCDAAND